MTHDERMHQLLYSNDGRVEQCERICKLEELVRDMWHLMDGSGVTTGAWGRCVQILNRMRELGVDV